MLNLLMYATSIDTEILTSTEVYDFRIRKITEMKSRQINYLYVGKICNLSEYTAWQKRRILLDFTAIA